jgi:hypothetical protein
MSNKNEAEQGIIRHIIDGLSGIKNGRFSNRSILDFKSKKNECAKAIRFSRLRKQ